MAQPALRTNRAPKRKVVISDILGISLKFASNSAACDGQMSKRIPMGLFKRKSAQYGDRELFLWKKALKRMSFMSLIKYIHLLLDFVTFGSSALWISSLVGKLNGY